MSAVVPRQQSKLHDAVPVSAGSVQSVTPPEPRRGLRHVLISIDCGGAALAWTVALTLPLGAFGSHALGIAQVLAIVIGLSVLLVGWNAVQLLYRARVCGVAAVEYVRLARSCGLLVVTAVVVGGALGGHVSWWRALTGGLLTLGLVGFGRLQFEDWLRAARRSGRHRRAVVVVGTGPDAQECVEILGDHPELGYEVRGVVGPSAKSIAGAPRLGGMRDLHRILTATRVGSVMIAADAISGTARDQLCQDLLARNIHVQCVGGVPGIASDRLRMVPLAHVPSFYIERRSLSRAQSLAKRALDLGLAGLGTLLMAPIFAAVALAIRFDDGGPVFFRQVRVGQNGREFRVWKFRTMVRDAEALQAQLASQNERSGPLFKLRDDPRRTRVGRLLEATSIDELPQLLNVLRGEMSLVGPRPALPREVATFDEGLLERLAVLPGVTGLWQLEARDNPSFRTYRRLDLFYVQNWSLGLDLAILAGTAHAVAARVLRRRAA